MRQAPERLKKRSEFRRVAAGRKWAAPGLVLQMRRRHGEATAAGQEAPPRVGFTVSKKVGNAVERNRVKRRLRALAAAVLDRHAAPATDYVLVGRRAALKRSYAALGADLCGALRRLGAYRDEKETARS